MFSFSAYLRVLYIATGKRGYPHNILFVSILKHMLWVLIGSASALEAPRQGASNEYPQHMLLWRNKKDISMFQLKKSALSVAMTVYTW